MGPKGLKLGISLYCKDENFLMISNLTKKNVAKKTGKGTKLQFLCTQGTLQGERA